MVMAAEDLTDDRIEAGRGAREFSRTRLLECGELVDSLLGVCALLNAVELEAAGAVNLAILEDGGLKERRVSLCQVKQSDWYLHGPL
jgi:hypothetical protein